MLTDPLLSHAPSSSVPRTVKSTHHSDGEVVVHDTVRHRVPSLVLVCGRDIDLPAIQHHLRAVFDVSHYLQEALALVASGRRKKLVKMGLEQLVLHVAVKNAVKVVQTSSELFVKYQWLLLIGWFFPKTKLQKRDSCNQKLRFTD